MKNKAPPIWLIMWAIVSSIIFVIGIGFAGGISRVFIIPAEADLLSLIVWAVAWVLIATPFLILTAFLVRLLVTRH